MLKSKIYLLFTILLLGFIGFSCSDSYIDNVERGGWYNYTAGFPELRLSTTSYYNEQGIPTIDVSGDVVYGGLIYKKNAEENIQADISVEIIVRDLEKNIVVGDEMFSKSLVSENNSVIHSQELFRFTEQFDVKPGDYEIKVIITDDNSDKQTVRKSTTSIEDIDKGLASISEIQIFGKESSKNPEFIPVTTYDVPANLDSLKFMVQVNNSTGSPINIRSNLKKFFADTSYAWSMSIQDYPRSSIRYQGIDYDEFKILQSGSRTINQNGYVFIEYSYEDLELGNYRLEIFVEGETGLLTEGGREFGIKPAFYPAVKTARQLAEPLVYIMKEKEYEQLMSIENNDSLRVAVDRFWLSSIKNSNIAKEVISLFYTRVEEANKQFSNYKEGWKTDPGMTYILFGRPLHINSFSKELLWSYSYNLSDDDNQFLFVKERNKNSNYPFVNYILDRDDRYYYVAYSQIMRWLDGSILKNRL